MSKAFSEVQLRLMGYMYEKPRKSNIKTAWIETELQGKKSEEIEHFDIRPYKLVWLVKGQSEHIMSESSFTFAHAPSRISAKATSRRNLLGKKSNTCTPVSFIVPATFSITFEGSPLASGRCVYN